MIISEWIVSYQIVSGLVTLTLRIKIQNSRVFEAGLLESEAETRERKK